MSDTDTDGEFQGLLEEMRKGSHSAAQKLIDDYGSHIRAVIRRRLNQKMRIMFDTCDFEQAVWASIIRIQPKLHTITEPAQFVALLGQMATRKVIDEHRRRTTSKYDMNRRCSLDSPTDFNISGGVSEMPSQIAIAREQWDRMLENQPERSKRILELRREGHTFEEIARMLEINERTVRRFMKDLMKEHGVDETEGEPEEFGS